MRNVLETGDFHPDPWQERLPARNSLHGNHVNHNRKSTSSCLKYSYEVRVDSKNYLARKQETCCVITKNNDRKCYD